MFAVIAVFLVSAGVFLLRYWIGEKLFWGRKYWKQGYRILLSRRFDAYLFDTIAVCFFSLFVLGVYFGGTSGTNAILCGLFALLFLGARLLEKTCIFYHAQGLLIVAPFRPLRPVPWSEIQRIQKGYSSAQIYHVLDQNGRRLAWFPLTLKTQPFVDLAQKNGISVRVSKQETMVLRTSSKRLNGTFGDWDAVLARSAYAKQDVIASVPFQDFIVVLFLDRHLHENNVIAVNRDGSTRWKIADIIRQPGPISYAALTPETETTVCVMAVASRQYDCTIYEVDVFTQQVVRQQSGMDP